MKTSRIMAIEAMVATTGLALHVGQAQQGNLTICRLLETELDVPARPV